MSRLDRSSSSGRTYCSGSSSSLASIADLSASAGEGAVVAGGRRCELSPVTCPFAFRGDEWDGEGGRAEKFRSASRRIRFVAGGEVGGETIETDIPAMRLIQQEVSGVTAFDRRWCQRSRLNLRQGFLV